VVIRFKKAENSVVLDNLGNKKIPGNRVLTIKNQETATFLHPIPSKTSAPATLIIPLILV